MTCNEVLAVLTESAPAGLKLDTGTPLGSHLATCEECRAAAERILAAHRALAAALTGVVSDELIRGAVAAARKRSTERRGWRRKAVIPLAAAAGIALLALVSGRDRPPAWKDLPRPTIASFSVEAPAGRNVVVMGTLDSNITVVWFY